VALDIHGADVDFAAWCSYKYLNGGPGCVGGAFVHERHARRTDLPRLAGWWGHDKATRFQMGPEFNPIAGAEGWQVSNQPILAMAPLAASLEHFAAAGLPALRRKSMELTGYLESLAHARLAGKARILTPSDPAARGAALSFRLECDRASARAAFDGLRARGILPDWREPGLIRAAPAPFYNTYYDVWRFVDTLSAELG
jgi:kynureninase